MFIRFINLPTFITLLGLSCAVVGCLLSLNHHLSAAAIMLILAGICDLFDGVIARKMKSSEVQKEFGREIDSIVDMASFGICPVIIITVAMSATSLYDYGIYVFYALTAALRLASFNVQGLSTTQDRSFYTGLPVTYAALIIPVGLLFNKVLSGPKFDWFLRCILLITALLFISKLKIPKPKGAALVFFPIAAVILIGVFTFFY